MTVRAAVCLSLLLACVPARTPRADGCDEFDTDCQEERAAARREPEIQRRLALADQQARAHAQEEERRRSLDLEARSIQDRKDWETREAAERRRKRIQLCRMLRFEAADCSLKSTDFKNERSRKLYVRENCTFSSETGPDERIVDPETRLEFTRKGELEIVRTCPMSAPWTDIRGRHVLGPVNGANQDPTRVARIHCKDEVERECADVIPDE